ncbi:MAG: D-tyrosyl-tRNA(Tyr) deacylase [endosymbiont of Galathealinum brachiosum]|uniref:D-aminoacyl-tRNA deacylase n=1 Tax=endosymbiont of Galathealinum brachiosum TaxID=2200906 RepID=A0A370DEQ6_9GAMM|nr:MAG: D-tyrosyl-tRNA(Tyr) deacylase [endosymbiont of Galathealinum brachiosum]
MIALIQRVSHANVVVSNSEIAQINKGLLVLLGVSKGDDAAKADKLVHRMLGYRVFEDTEGKMNLSVKDVGGEILLVPQFTLAADTKSGMRPGFSTAAPPEEGVFWFDYVAGKCKKTLGKVQLGEFGADMKVGLLNDGPVTFWLET